MVKVIGAGFGRTGTNSFMIAMETLGFAPCHHMRVLMRTEPDADAWQRAAAGTLENWDEIYGDFVATCDFPHCVFYGELAAFYPDAKVVLTVRDPDDWYASVTKTIFSTETLGQLQEFAAGEGPSADRTNSFLKIFGRVIDLDGIGDRQATIEAFELHNEAVRSTIPSDRLLVYEVAEGWGPLCSFLGVPVPDEPFPLTNTTEEFQARRGRHADGT